MFIPRHAHRKSRGQHKATPDSHLSKSERIRGLLAAAAAGVMMVAAAGFMPVAESPKPTTPPVAVTDTLVQAEPKAPVKTVPLKKSAPATEIKRAATYTNMSYWRSIAIANSARAMVGWRQDCVLMAARAIYWNTGRWIQVWPWQYYWYGYPVSYAQARPGDLVYYRNGGGGLAHIAVYLGNGWAVHGGWNGYTTVVYSVWIGSGPNFIRLR